MNDYNFWADLLDTFQSSSDFIKALWLLVPPTFLLALIAMLMRFRIASKRAEIALEGELVYSVHRGADDELRIVCHAPQVDLKQIPVRQWSDSNIRIPLIHAIQTNVRLKGPLANI